jgi:formylglycine-generating enzyme required for sulfatase activity
MIAVQGGTFTMGCVTERDVDCAPDENPHHTVILSNFRIGKFPVTQEEWLAVMGDNPAGFTGLDRPVEKVSWEEVQEFLLRLNALTGKNYRLPTEAEWEFAARGGILSQGFMFSGSNDLDMVAWYSDNSGHETKPVGQKHPNELGLYDMSGNVWEWCSDWYGTYNNIEETNPQGPVEGSRRVLRGGSWLNLARHCRISNREHRQPVYRPDNQGFRLAMTDD